MAQHQIQPSNNKIRMQNTRPDPTSLDPTSSLHAAIDLGSNSFHMLVVDTGDGQLQEVHRAKQMVQAARGLLDNGSLTDESRQRARQCLQGFATALQELNCHRVYAVATQVFREASNGAAFIEDAERLLGHPITIISGEEEAQLVYRGVSQSHPDYPQQRLVIDIGGGSTEFILGNGQQVYLARSLDIGCVTFAERFISASLKRSMLNDCLQATKTLLQPLADSYRQQGWEVAIGASGTLRIIAELLSHDGVADGTDQLGTDIDGEAGLSISYQGLLKLIEQTLLDGELKCDSPASLRRDVLPAGLAILKGIFDTLGIEKLEVAEATLKQGLIYRALTTQQAAQ